MSPVTAADGPPVRACRALPDRLGAPLRRLQLTGNSEAYTGSAAPFTRVEAGSARYR